MINRQVFMKKKFLYGMIVLLSVSLFFLGCPTEADDGDTTGAPVDDSGGTSLTPGEAAKALAKTLTDLGFTVVDSGNGSLSITGAGGTTALITQPFSVPAGVTLTLTEGATVTSTITVGSDATVAIPAGKDLIVSTGTINNAGAIEVTGTYTLQNTAHGANTGTVTVKSGGQINSGAPISGNGINVVESGGKVSFNDTGSPLFIDNSTGLIKLSTSPAGKFSYGNGFYAVEAGEVTLDGAALLDSQAEPLTIKAGAKLIIDGTNGDLTLRNSTAANPTLRGLDGAQIEIESSGSITFASGAGVEVNFYDSTGTQESSPPADDDTYTWGTVPGESFSGWVGTH
jgi:hypothetical protein